MSDPIRYERRGGGDQLVYGELEDGDEIPLAALDDGTLRVFTGLEACDLLSEILAELRVINKHLLTITDERFVRD
jgi:hypothetical protein